MCGIVGYIGNNSALEVLLSGLEKLEYRGYDSAGVALNLNDKIEIEREVGRLSGLRSKVSTKEVLSSADIGIGHTRWATHGGPSEANAHPHKSDHLALVHNGIIENYIELKRDLEKKGYEFKSETDTEVAAHLLHSIVSDEAITPDKISELLNQVVGSYAFVALSDKDKDTLMVARDASPLVIGVGEGENFIASDVTALLEYTKKVIYLEDGDYATVKRDAIEIYNSGELVTRDIHEIEWDITKAQRGGYKHFMIKEIYDQPKAINDTLSGRLTDSHSNFKLPELDNLTEEIKNLKRIKLIACGTAWHAAQVGKFYFEQIARIPAEVEIASEFRYKNPIISDDELLISVSQSGETADTLAAIEIVKGKCPTIGVTNVLGSSITRNVDSFLLTQAGPEISVASTKAFTTQGLVMYLMALKFASLKNEINEEQLAKSLSEVTHLSHAITEVLEKEEEIKKIAEKYVDHKGFFFLGRGACYPIALEGALKLKEITYLHAEGYPSGELKHGPIALISPDLPTVAVLQSEEPHFSKMLSNLNEVKSRDGKIIVITDSDSVDEVSQVATDVIKVPYINHHLMPLISVIPLQLFSYYMADKLEREIDFPRNLAKSVTVE